MTDYFLFPHFRNLSCSKNVEEKTFMFNLYVYLSKEKEVNFPELVL